MLKNIVRRFGVRWLILGLIVLGASINYIDRQVLSVLAPLLRKEFGWSNTAYSVLVFMFLLGWAMGEIPIGIYFDRVGSRKGYRIIVLAWSLIIGLHSLAYNIFGFAALRYLLGFCECGNWSGGMKVIASWFPTEERARATGIFNGAINIGAIVAAPLTVWLTIQFGWRIAFLIPACLGIVWFLLWISLYHSPDTHPWISEKELRFISSPRENADLQIETRETMRFSDLIHTSQAWGLMISRFLIGPVWSLYVFWLPQYLKHDRHMSLTMIGLVDWIPFAISLVGNVAGGEFSSLLIRHGRHIFSSRQMALTIGALLSATGVWVGLNQSTLWSFVMVCVAAFGLSFWAANYYALISDTFPSEVVGRVTGFTGVGNGLGGMIFMLATGIVVDHFSYLPIFILSTIMPLAALLVLFLLVRTPVGGQSDSMIHAKGVDSPTVWS